MLHTDPLTDLIDWQNPVSEHPLNLGLVSWYLAHPERSGGVYWRDLCGRNHGTLTNMDPATDWLGPQGRPGGFGSLDFDGSDDYVNVADETTLSFVSGGISVFVWLYARNLATTQLVGKYDNAAGSFEWAVQLVSSRIYGFVYDNSTAGYRGRYATIAPYWQTGEWVGITWTYDGTGASAGSKVFFNGVQRDTTNFQSGTFVSPEDTNASLLIGTTGGANYLDGIIDDVRIYNRALSAAEVAELYHESKAGHPATLRRVTVPLWTPQAAAGGLSIPIAMYHYLHHIQKA